MRTVDPALWSKKAKGRAISLAWPQRFGHVRRGLEARLRDSLRDAMGEFCRNCSVGGVRKAAGEASRRSERYRWMVLLTVCLMAGTLTISVNLADLVTEPPLAISLQSSQHSIQKPPFPAIGLCSYNVVSQKTLRLYSTTISQMDANRTYSMDAIRRNLLDSGALVTLALPVVDLQFAHYLQGLDPNKKYNITKLMFELAPTCEALLEKCSWAGRERPCHRLFATRITSVGYCCVFNGRYEDVDRHTPPKTLNRVGSDYGLSVVVKENSDDFAYLRKPSVGIEVICMDERGARTVFDIALHGDKIQNKVPRIFLCRLNGSTWVLIFDGTEYPFLEGGAVRVQIAPLNTSVYYAVSTRSQYTSRSLEYFTEAWRGCRIRQYAGAPGERSYSWCLLECRRYNALQLCGCVPYTLQPRKHQTCTLNELACLNKHREKFLSYHPFGYTMDHPDGEALSEELQDALFCDECLVDCARPVYGVKPSYAVFQHNMFKNKFTHGVNLTNASVLRFFYSTEDQHLYAVECNSEWYEIFAYICSQWFVLLGISLVTMFEVVFHCTVRWGHHYLRRSRLFAN